MEWTKKDLLSLYDLSREEIVHILDTAEEFKKVSQRNVKKVPALRERRSSIFLWNPVPAQDYHLNWRKSV